MYFHSILVGILGGLGTPELILIAIVVLIFFGGKKIPELMHGVGKGVKSFKEGMSGLENDLHEPEKKAPETEKEKNSQS